MASTDVVDWLLEPDDPVVRHATLRRLLRLAADDPIVVDARQQATASHPISAILAAQHPDGHWEKPGPGYATKYRGTVWQLIFLDQLAADPEEPGVRRASEYVLSHTIAETGGFGASGRIDAEAPPPSSVIHCLNGNLLRAVIHFGRLDDPRVQGAIDWEARAITGIGMGRWLASGTSGPGFRCGANEGQPCAWGAVKALLGLAAIPPDRRSPLVVDAISAGAEFLLSRDPAVADYPMPSYASRPNGSWFRLGFPSGYVTDVLQNLEALVELGLGGDARLDAAFDLVRSKQDAAGRWRNEYAYNRKTWVDFERQRKPSKWVTLRALAALRDAGRAA